MNGLVLFEDERFVDLLPLTFWRSVFELRVGRTILLDRTARQLELPITGVWTRDWFAPVAQHRCGAPVNRPVDAHTLLVNGRWVFDDPVTPPPAPSIGVVGDEVVCIACDEKLAESLTPSDMLNAQRRDHALGSLPRLKMPGELIQYPWDIIARLSQTLTTDFHPRDAVLEERLDERVVVENSDMLHVGVGTHVHPTAVLDASSGPIYVSENVRIGAHCVIEGPAYIGPGCRINPHAWLHGGNSLGPICKVGGELDGCVLHGYTNKQHEGFLGHAYVGSWVNLGAGTVNSDLKNTYGNVRVPINGTEVDSGQMFFGAVIADQVKTAINTSLPTGAVIGFASVLANGGLAPKYVPSFAWVTDSGLGRGDPARLLDVAVKVMSRRRADITDEEVELFLELGNRVREYERGSP